jgi:hypothetical protein
MSLLAPDIVEAILDGVQPVDAHLELFLQRLPSEWEAQRRALERTRS